MTAKKESLVFFRFSQIWEVMKNSVSVDEIISKISLFAKIFPKT